MTSPLASSRRSLPYILVYLPWTGTNFCDMIKPPWLRRALISYQSCTIGARIPFRGLLLFSAPWLEVDCSRHLAWMALRWIFIEYFYTYAPLPSLHRRRAGAFFLFVTPADTSCKFVLFFIKGQTGRIRCPGMPFAKSSYELRSYILRILLS